MASILKLQGKWRALVRTKECTVCKTFEHEAQAVLWALGVEDAIKAMRIKKRKSSVSAGSEHIADQIVRKQEILRSLEGDMAQKLKEFVRWRGMHYRCYAPQASNYHHYGGRGIQVDDRWFKFANFWSDMGAAPAGMSLDRIDPNGNYSPGNCRWASTVEQRKNQNPKGVKRTKGAIAQQHGVKVAGSRSAFDASKIFADMEQWKLARGLS